MRPPGALLLCMSLPLAILPGRRATAEESVTDTAGKALRCIVTIRADADSARVMIDSAFAGFTPLTIDTLRAGLHRLCIQDPDRASWLTQDVTDTLVLKEGEARTLQYSIPRLYRILTEPFGAEVLRGDSLVGTTPLYISPPATWLTGPFRIRKDGFEPAVVNLADARGRVVKLDLKRIWQPGDDREPLSLTAGVPQKSPVRTYIAGAVTVLSGVAAAYFKIKADAQFQTYQQTNDPSLLSQTHRLDTASGISLVATQIGMGFFMYFLFAD